MKGPAGGKKCCSSTLLTDMSECQLRLPKCCCVQSNWRTTAIRLKIYYAWKGRCRDVSRFFCPKLLPLFCLMEYGLCKGKEPRPFMYFAAVRISVMRPHLNAIESWVQTSFFFLTAGTFLFLFRFCLRNRQPTFRKVITTWYCTP